MQMRDIAGHQAMLQCRKAWKRVKANQSKLWSDWTMEIGPALMKARTEAMAVAHTNQPKGRGYNEAMSGLLKEYEVADMGETARAHVLKIMEHLAEVEEWRAKQKDPDDLNHPSRVWLKYQKSSAQADERTQQERKERKAEREASQIRGTRALEDEIERLKAYIHEIETALAQREQENEQLRQELEAARPPAQAKRRGRPPGSKSELKPASTRIDPDGTGHVDLGFGAAAPATPRRRR